MRKRLVYLINKERKSMDFFKQKGEGYVIVINLSLFITIIILVIFAFSSVSNATTQEKLVIPSVRAESSFKTVKTHNEDVSYEKAIYSVELAEELKQPIIDKIYKEAKKHYKNVEIEHLEIAYDVCQNRIDEKTPLTMKEFLNLFVLNVTIMEIESNFTEDIKGINSTSTDHGIMQINSMVIETAEKELGRILDVENNLYDNIDTGSWEVFECYSKAKDKHPDNVLWWTYVYYNRGLFVENTTAWKTGLAYDQANTRSKIFLNTYNKYCEAMWS